MARDDVTEGSGNAGELTAQQAADLLNVPLSYLDRLVAEGQVRCRGAGHERRFARVEVLAFKDSRDRARLRGLDELTRLSEEFGGYGELK
jgi:excisionase family DNA binding protein